MACSFYGLVTHQYDKNVNANFCDSSKTKFKWLCHHKYTVCIAILTNKIFTADSTYYFLAFSTPLFTLSKPEWSCLSQVTEARQCTKVKTHMSIYGLQGRLALLLRVRSLFCEHQYRLPVAAFLPQQLLCNTATKALSTQGPVPLGPWLLNVSPVSVFLGSLVNTQISQIQCLQLTWTLSSEGRKV